jgi:hypothetical protein
MSLLLGSTRKRVLYKIKQGDRTFYTSSLENLMFEPDFEDMLRGANRGDDEGASKTNSLRAIEERILKVLTKNSVDVHKMEYNTDGGYVLSDSFGVSSLEYLVSNLHDQPTDRE